MSATPHHGRILVAGGSIGGLTTAVLLRDLGFDVHVFERSSSALQSRGAGIVVLPMTERYFTERSVGAERVSLTLKWWVYIDPEGRVLSADPDWFRFSAWSTIYRALLDAFDPDRYHLESEMVGFDQDETSVTLRLADGRRVEGDLLVCADGISSMARSILLPGVDPVYAGYVAWRGVTAESSLSDVAMRDVENSMLYQVLDPGHILVYAVPDQDGTIEAGSRMMNFVWYRNYSEGDAADSMMTATDGERKEATVPPGLVSPTHLDEMTRASDELAPTIREIVSRCDDPFIQAIYDLEVPQMVFGRVCLLGDAAFGVRPHLAAGQAKACADAWALHDDLVATEGDIDAALERWEPRQLALGRNLVERSRQMGIRSQFEGAMTPGDPHWKFGLHPPVT